MRERGAGTAPVSAALEVLATIHARLGGDLSVLHASRANLLLPVDLVHTPTGIELHAEVKIVGDAA